MLWVQMPSESQVYVCRLYLVELLYVCLQHKLQHQAISAAVNFSLKEESNQKYSTCLLRHTLQFAFRRFLFHELFQNVYSPSRPLSQVVLHGRPQNLLYARQLLGSLGSLPAIVPALDLGDVALLHFVAPFLAVNLALEGRYYVSHDGQDFHLEDQNFPSSNFGRTSTVAVGKIAWNVEFPLCVINIPINRFVRFNSLPKK